MEKTLRLLKEKNPDKYSRYAKTTLYPLLKKIILYKGTDKARSFIDEVADLPLGSFTKPLIEELTQQYARRKTN